MSLQGQLVYFFRLFASCIQTHSSANEEKQIRESRVLVGLGKPVSGHRGRTPRRFASVHRRSQAERLSNQCVCAAAASRRSMSVNGAVYQPTTVTYESQEEHAAHHQHHHAGGGSQSSHWAQRPISYIAASVSQAARRPCGISCVPLQTVLPVVYLTSAIATFAIGLTMLIHGVIGYVDMPPTASEAFYVSVAVIGALLLVAGGLFVALFLRHTRRSCFRAGKDHLDTSGAGAQALTVNPSTDLLVAAQYAPVSEVAYQPPSDESEQSKLMPQENKEIVDDTDRMLESDPRIVLRPLQQPNTSEDA